jgi:hypothetical protein
MPPVYRVLSLGERNEWSDLKRRMESCSLKVSRLDGKVAGTLRRLRHPLLSLIACITS